MDTLTTAQAIKRVTHVLERNHGRRLLPASVAAKREQRLVKLSGVLVVPDDDEGKQLGFLVQAWLNHDPSGADGNELFAMCAAAAEKAGYPVQYAAPVQSPSGDWWHRNAKLSAPPTTRGEK